MRHLVVQGGGTHEAQGPGAREAQGNSVARRKALLIANCPIMIGGNVAFPDRREAAPLQNPGEASLEAASRGRWRSSGDSWRPLEPI